LGRKLRLARLDVQVRSQTVAIE